MREVYCKQREKGHRWSRVWGRDEDGGTRVMERQTEGGQGSPFIREHIKCVWGAFSGCS